MSGCGNNQSAANGNTDIGTALTETVEEAVELTYSENITNAKLPNELSEIPQEYFTGADHQGTLVEIGYDTYESMSYEQQTTVLHKRAIVYLPYGYSEDTQYNVFYLMHGGWSDETAYLGTPENPSVFKNVLDQGMEDGKIQPMIIVCPTYNNESEKDSWDYSLAIRLTDNYHNELVNDLIPAVEGTYSTYAEDTTLEGIRRSRDHRAFCGFSMGSVATWRTFQYCLDYFRYFMPSSGNLTTDGEYMASLVRNSGYEWNDFFIFAASGTEEILHWGISEANEEYLRRAHAVCPVTAVENRYSMMARQYEELFPVLEELGVGLVAFSPMANGFLTGRYGKGAQFDQKYDYRSNMPQFTDEAIDQNQKLLELLHTIAENKNATPAQISMAWMLCKKPWIVPIPGTRKRERMQENMAAADVRLSAEDVKVLDDALGRMEMSEVFGGSRIVKVNGSK